MVLHWIKHFFFFRRTLILNSYVMACVYIVVVASKDDDIVYIWRKNNNNNWNSENVRHVSNSQISERDFRFTLNNWSMLNLLFFCVHNLLVSRVRQRFSLFLTRPVDCSEYSEVTNKIRVKCLRFEIL